MVAPPPPPMIRDKKPSAYSAMKHGDTISHIPSSATVAVEGPTKRGRPSKEEARKHKLQMASSVIATLIASKPKKEKIREYISARIMELDAEKK